MGGVVQTWIRKGGAPKEETFPRHHSHHSLKDVAPLTHCFLVQLFIMVNGRNYTSFTYFSYSITNTKAPWQGHMEEKENQAKYAYRIWIKWYTNSKVARRETSSIDQKKRNSALCHEMTKFHTQ